MFIEYLFSIDNFFEVTYCTHHIKIYLISANTACDNNYIYNTYDYPYV